ncbi:MAG: cell envelope integrity protein TolA [Burkholderiales bacterium]|nr:cell envelope integrity protein TolA [Burkholderiales bacterium]
MFAHTTTRLEFAPPPTPGLMRALGLAIVAHALLLAVLALGVQWKRDATPVTVEAELWSALQVEAAPPPPPPPPPVEPEPIVKPPPPKPTVAPPAPTPPQPDPAIAIAREKARLQKEKQLEQERLEKLEQEKRQKEALKQKKLKDEQAAKEARERELRDKATREKKLQQEQQKQQTAKSAAEAKKMEELRQQQIARALRMAGQAEGTGSADARGTAKQSSGPSASYGGRIKARVKPNITYTDTPVGNPAAEVEVRTSPDGTIISRKLVKSSGVKSWDDAVLNAIDKTEVLPRDVDGRVPPLLILVFQPKD